VNRGTNAKLTTFATPEVPYEAQGYKTAKGHITALAREEKISQRQAKDQTWSA